MTNTIRQGTPATEEAPRPASRGDLHDLFAWPDGRRVTAPAQWPDRARAWRDLIVNMEYGGLPPPPDAVRVESLCHSRVSRWPSQPNLESYRVHCEGGLRPFSFAIRVLFPRGRDPVPAVINGDGCWWYVTESIAQRVVEAGYALMQFNRTEMAEDLGYEGVLDKTRRSGGLYEVYPGRTFGALAAWAWGYHRCVDALHQLPFLDPRRIAATGHSRGGKTVLLAGATDERITLVNDNASCAGGAAVFRYVGTGGETLNIVNVVPSWFGPAIREFAGREQDLPFDQHALLALMAPRPLLITYSVDDRWSNPEGMVQSVWAAREVYRFLGCPEHLAFHLRRGPHAHAPEDWEVLLDFMKWKWAGHAPAVSYNEHPYREMRPAFGWRAPTS